MDFSIDNNRSRGSSYR